jgi:VCBS repeat-containing protein
VDITVSAPNNVPTATGEAYATNEDVSLIVKAPGVLANDTDPDGDKLAAQVTVKPLHGSLVLSASGLFVYTPNRNYFGPDSFTYVASDGRGGTATASVTLTVNSVNDSPVAATDKLTIREDTAITVNVLANDGDAESNPLTIQSFTQGLHGTVTQTPDKKLRYTPAANYFGYDRFYYTINDGLGGTSTAAVTFSLTSVNDAPINTMPAALPKIHKGGSLALTGANKITVRDPDSVYAQLTTTLTASTGKLHLGSSKNVVAAGNNTRVLTLVGIRSAINAALLTVRFTPDARFTGTARIDVNTNDNGNIGAGGAKHDLDTLFIGVDDKKPFPTSRVASQGTFTTPANTKLTISVDNGLKRFFSDPNGDPLTFVVVTRPATGTFTYSSNGSFTYTPASNFHGRVTFTAKATDGSLDSDVATFHIDVV